MEIPVFESFYLLINRYGVEENLHFIIFDGGEYKNALHSNILYALMQSFYIGINSFAMLTVLTHVWSAISGCGQLTVNFTFIFW